MSITAMTNGLHPGARLLYFVLRDMADQDGTVVVPSAELLRATGWQNRASLRKRSRELVEAGVITVEQTTQPTGAGGPNRYTLQGGDQ